MRLIPASLLLPLALATAAQPQTQAQAVNAAASPYRTLDDRFTGRRLIVKEIVERVRPAGVR
jgi:hypothetical protein